MKSLRLLLLMRLYDSVPGVHSAKTKPMQSLHIAYKEDKSALEYLGMTVKIFVKEAHRCYQLAIIEVFVLEIVSQSSEKLT
jgi:hypothetical protein